MRRFLFALAGLVVGVTSPQAQSRNWTIGPVIGLDTYRVLLPKGASTAASITNTPSISYGLDLSWKLHRLLFDMKVLTASQTFTYSQGYPIMANPNDTYTFRLRARQLKIPLTLSYQVLSRAKLALFAGGGLITEWQAGDYATQGIVRVAGEIASSREGNLADENPGAQAGYSLQAVLRYALDSRLLLSIEPAYQHFREVGKPAGRTVPDRGSLLVSGGYRF